MSSDSCRGVFHQFQRSQQGTPFRPQPVSVIGPVEEFDVVRGLKQRDPSQDCRMIDTKDAGGC